MIIPITMGSLRSVAMRASNQNGLEQAEKRSMHIAIRGRCRPLRWPPKVRDVKSTSHGDAIDEVTFDYVIPEDGRHSFWEVTDVQLVDASFSKRVLLIGAGFSQNWGGLIASELSGRLMSHPVVQARPRVAELSFARAVIRRCFGENTDWIVRGGGCRSHGDSNQGGVRKYG